MDITEILSNAGVEIPEDKLSAFNKEFRKAYKSEQEFNNKVTSLTTERDNLQTKYDDLSKSIEGDEGYKTKLTQLEGEKNDLQTKYNDVNEKYTLSQNLIKVNNAGVSKDFAEFVATTVKKQVDADKDGKIDFDTALKNYIAENPQYKGSGNKVKVNTSTGFKGDDGKGKDVNTIMNDALLKAIGKK